MTRPGLTLPLLGLAIFLAASILPLRTYLQARKPLVPVIASVALPPGVITAQLKLHVAEAGPYSFSIAVDDSYAAPTVDSPKVNCLLGGLRDEGDPTIGCAQYGKPVHLTWQLHDATGRTLGNGTWPSGPVGGSSDQQDRKRNLQAFATPTLTPGDYTLDVANLFLPSYLAALHPAIESIFENEHYDYYKDWNTLFATLASAFAALLGLALAIVGIIRLTTSSRPAAS